MAESIPVRGAVVEPGTPRSCRTREGREKRRFMTRGEARAAAKATNVPGVRAYRCPNCPFFHVGHP